VRIREKHSNFLDRGGGETMIEISDRNFDEEVAECELPVFACFTATWCGSCFPTCLVADDLVKEYKGSVKFVRLDTEKNPKMAQRYRVIAVPTILVFQNSQEVNRLLGFQDRSTLKSLLDNVTEG
jgi:thioredoxin 1